MKIVILGLSITSSWGNGHATTYRGLVKALTGRGHQVLFLERDVPWYADNRDLPQPRFGKTVLYRSFDQLRRDFAAAVAGADLVVVGSYVPDGVEVARWVLSAAGGVTAFYDIDTPVTLAKLERGEEDYLSRDLIPAFDLYLTFTGGPVLERLARDHGARRVRPLYCAVDGDLHRPVTRPLRWDLGYMGTYSEDRQPKVEALLFEVARRSPERRFALAGPQYPEALALPANVEHFTHLPPAEHSGFYCAQRYTLNLTRADMVAAGWSPSVRLFEAAACGVAVISDDWPGLEAFFMPGREILVARGTEDVVGLVGDLPEPERRALGEAARRRVLDSHSVERRAEELEGYLAEVTETADGAARSDAA